MNEKQSQKPEPKHSGPLDKTFYAAIILIVLILLAYSVIVLVFLSNLNVKWVNNH